MTTPREERLAAALKDIAAMECVYGDGCNPIPLGGVADAPCAVCRAREALESPLPPEETDRAEGMARELEVLIEAFGGHGSHWDYTMQAGAGCEQCHRESAAKTRARDALRAYRSFRPVKGG